MAVSTQQLRLMLNADEPDYAGLARLGGSLLPQLAQLVSDRDEDLAANAAALAGMIGGEQAVAVLQRAARSPSGLVRAATAGALRGVRSPQAATLVATLRRDADQHVRKFADKAAMQPASAVAEIGETFAYEQFEDESFDETEWGEQEAEWGEGPFGETFEFGESEFGEGEFELEQESGAAYIRWVQESLNRLLGLQLAVDGIVGPMTRSAIRSFQQRNGLTVDGIVGPRTEAALVAAGAARPPGSAGQGAGAQPGGGAAPCPPQPINVDCPPPGTPTEVLDEFRFDNESVVAARHGPRIAALAGRIIASQSSRDPIRTALIAGHTDVVGDDDYNFQLGWRRARAVMDALCRQLEALRPGFSRTFRFQLTSCGERQPKATAEQSRRVEIFLPTSPGPKRLPPDGAGCGVPIRALRGEINLEAEIQQRQRVARARGRAQSRLSLFQNAPTRSHRNHFHCQAVRWAGRIAAVANPTGADCPRRVGATPYDTGADIIQAIENARACTGSAVTAVHIFSHSGSYGVFGSLSAGSVGLYRDGVDAASRRDGAREIADIPTAPFADNVVIVLHGCNTAKGDNSFAQRLFEHLARKLKNPIVFGHPNSGCAGRDNSWREFSDRAPRGARRASIAPHYSGDGCCG